MNNAAGKIKERHPQRRLAIFEERKKKKKSPFAELAWVFILPLAVLACVAGLASRAAVATVSEALTGGRKPARKSFPASAEVKSKKAGGIFWRFSEFAQSR